jgi:hypothetical protein
MDLSNGLPESEGIFQVPPTGYISSDEEEIKTPDYIPPGEEENKTPVVHTEQPSSISSLASKQARKDARRREGNEFQKKS